MKIASIYVGTVIGAGFASGIEIVEFFGVYGIKGILGMVISGLLFSIVGSLLLIKMYNNRIGSLRHLSEKIFKDKFWIIFDTIIGFSLYTGYSVMISASGAIFEQELSLSYDIGIFFMVVATFIVFLFNLKGLSFISTLLVPLLIVGILFTSIYVNTNQAYNLSNVKGVSLTGNGNFITSAFLYFGSNCLIIIIVFSSLLPLIKDKKTAILGGTVGGIILFMLGLSILISTLIYYNEVAYLDIPMLKICDHIGIGYRKIYAIILWIAVFTTAVANGFGFMNRVASSRRLLYTGIFCISAIPLAKFGFGNLVSTIYPIFGFIGVGMMFFILIYL